MECEERRALDAWMRNCSDLVEFEVVRVASSDEARRRALAE
jgi:hypothetical protein